ncbi:MAG: M23 family metallopeptidase [Bacteroidetes bacterium]|nr:MAG: M23 family metallopeptidase [Bacteroidota bacterium]TAG90724.1 MAG: M23 family metallopeptidase [Bacteroidota bacterium]
MIFTKNFNYIIKQILFFGLFILFFDFKIQAQKKEEIEPTGYVIELYNLEDKKFWSPPFITERVLVSSPFGWRSSGYHPGIDLALKRGEPILSVFDGVIKTSAYNAGYGNYIVITHDNGLETLYAHLDARVRAGSRVRAGQLIALSGNTGWSTGAHLHFEIYYQNKLLNPEWFFDFSGKITVRSQFIRLPMQIILPKGKLDRW